MLEHRWSERVAVNCNAILSSKDRCVFATIRNVSHYGLYIETFLPFSRNTVVEVRFSLPGEGKRRRLLRAMVVHANDSSNGLIVKVHDSSVKTVIDALVTQCGEPSVLRRRFGLTMTGTQQ